jgi:hypothetical protein
MAMEYNYKRTFDAVDMPPERKGEIRAALSSRCSEKQKEEYNMNGKGKIRLAVFAAVAALTCALLAGFAYAYGTQIVEMLSGGRIEIGPNFRSVDAGFDIAPAEVREGRIIFTLDGSDADITGYCSETTYYQYELTDANGYRHVVLVGGTPDDLEWAEFVLNKDGSHIASSAVITFDGDQVPAWLTTAQKVFTPDIDWE